MSSDANIIFCDNKQPIRGLGRQITDLAGGVLCE